MDDAADGVDMNSGLWTVAFAALGIGLVAFLATRMWWRKKVWDEAAVTLREAIPIWASFGPFQNESHSAMAVYISHLLTRGSDSSSHAQGWAVRHEMHYRKEPAIWEKNRQQTIQSHPFRIQDGHGSPRSYFEGVRARAHRLVGLQRQDLAIQLSASDELSAYLNLAVQERLLLSLEMQYLWGVFSQSASSASFDVPEDDLTMAHLIDWLVVHQGMNIEEAIGEASDIRGLLEENDPLFMAIAKRGSNAFNGTDEPDFFKALYAVDERLRALVDPMRQEQ